MLDERPDAFGRNPEDPEPTVFASIAPTPALREEEPYARDELLQEIFDATCLRHAHRCAVRLLGDGHHPGVHRIELRTREGHHLDLTMHFEGEHGAIAIGRRVIVRVMIAPIPSSTPASTKALV